MSIVFYIAAIVAVLATILVITHSNTVHALLYMITSILALSVIFFILGAPFIAALEVIIYAGAIMILFVFVAMMMNLGEEQAKLERKWLSWKAWTGPGILSLILLAEFIYVLTNCPCDAMNITPISPQEVGTALYTKYILGVELTAMLLMSAAVGAFHIGRQKMKEYHRFLQDENDD